MGRVSEDHGSTDATLELLQRTLAGDREAGVRLCVRIESALSVAALRHPLRGRLPPGVDAEDIVNETWRSVLHGDALQRFGDEQSGGLLRFLRKVLDRRMIDAVQRAQREGEREAGAEGDQDARGALHRVPQSREPSPTSMARAEELLALLPHVLSERDAELARGYAQGWSVADLASRLGIERAAAERALSRAKRKLEAWLAGV